MFKKGQGEKVGNRPEVEDKRTERESEALAWETFWCKTETWVCTI